MSDKNPNFLKNFLKSEQYVRPLMLAGSICIAAAQTYSFGGVSISLTEWIISIVVTGAAFLIWVSEEEK